MEVWELVKLVGQGIAVILGPLVLFFFKSQQNKTKDIEGNISELKIRMSVMESEVAGIKDDIREIKEGQIRIINLIQKLLENAKK